jgi:serine/threonine-protein kinase
MALTTVEPDRGEVAHVNPYLLPDSQAVMFHLRLRGQTQNEGPLVVWDRASGRRVEIAAAGTEASYVPGRIVYADSQGILQSLPFDRARLEPSGPPTPLAERVFVPRVGAPLFSAAVSGALAFVPAVEGPSPESARSVVWVDRQRREEPLAVPAREYAAARLSPDGTRIALDIRDQGSDVWIWSIDRGALTRLTSSPTLDFGPVWTPDGRRVIWSSTRDTSNPALYSQAADGTGAAERIGSDGGAAVFAGAVTPDGQHLLFYGAENIVQRLGLDGRGQPDTVLQGSSLLATPEVSPDGRWLAYQSNESGVPEIYVRPYPSVEGGRWQISTQGGTRPVWSRNGRELFFLDAGERLSVVPVTVSGETLVPGTVRRLLETAYYPGFTTRGFNLRGYDVSSDGERFLMIKANDGTGPSASVMTIVLNWPQP